MKNSVKSHAGRFAVGAGGREIFFVLLHLLSLRIAQNREDNTPGDSLWFIASPREEGIVLSPPEQAERFLFCSTLLTLSWVNVVCGALAFAEINSIIFLYQSSHCVYVILASSIPVIVTRVALL